MCCVRSHMHSVVVVGRDLHTRGTAVCGSPVLSLLPLSGCQLICLPKCNADAVDGGCIRHRLSHCSFALQMIDQKGNYTSSLASFPFIATSFFSVAMLLTFLQNLEVLRLRVFIFGENKVINVFMSSTWPNSRLSAMVTPLVLLTCSIYNEWFTFPPLLYAQAQFFSFAGVLLMTTFSSFRIKQMYLRAFSKFRSLPLPSLRLVQRHISYLPLSNRSLLNREVGKYSFVAFLYAFFP